MKWILKEIEIGDMVRVPMKEVYHYGVCTGEDRIIQFGEPVLTCPKPKEEIRVIAADVSSFLGGQFAEVAVFDKKELRNRRPVGEIVAYAEKSLGKGGYDILYNNCEHFANECVFGTHTSSQIDRIRSEVEAKMPCITVYVGAVEDFCHNDTMPRYAAKELKKITNEQVINEKKAGWGLLKRAAERMENQPDIKKAFLGKTGKPLHKDFSFSVSHSDGLVAAAVANVPVGLDLEARGENEERQERLLERIIHENEKKGDPTLLWTLKEAAFKFCGTEKTFLPASIDVNGYKSRSVQFEYNGKSFVISVVADITANVRFNSLTKNEEINFQNLKEKFIKE